MFKNQELNSLKTIIILVVVVGAVFFTIKAMHKDTDINSAKVIGKTEHINEVNNTVYTSTSIGKVIPVIAQTANTPTTETIETKQVSDSVSASSTCDATTAPFVNVLIPQGATIHPVSNNLKVKWQECNITIPQMKVTVTLVDMNTLSVMDDTSPMNDTGAYTFLLPNNLPANTHYKIAVTLWNSQSQFTGYSDLSSEFTITNLDPKIWLVGALYTPGLFVNPFTITSNSICLSGIYSAGAGNQNLTTWFEYGLNQNYGYSTAPVLQNTLAGITPACISGLMSNTDYYVQMKAQNAAGTYTSQGYAIVHTL